MQKSKIALLVFLMLICAEYLAAKNARIAAINATKAAISG
jgi:hypothetical protein